MQGYNTFKEKLIRIYYIGIYIIIVSYVKLYLINFKRLRWGFFFPADN